jgi:hypothetical protein
MSLRVRRAGIIAVAFVAGASILRVSSSAAAPFSSSTGGAQSEASPPSTPAPNPSPESLSGSSSASSASNGSFVTLSAGRAVAMSDGPYWAIRLPASGSRASARPTLRSRLAATASVGRTTTVMVRVGSRHREVVLTNATTVGQLLRAMKIRLGHSKMVRPGPRAALTAGRQIRVIQVRRVTEKVTAPIPFTTVIHYTTDLAAGQSEVSSSGADGTARQTVVSTYLNGRLISRKIVASQVIVAPVEQVVFKGTSKTPGGSRVGVASWYGCSGYHAASPWLPFGTVVHVLNVSNGRSVSVVINDRGPYGPGRIIDLCSPAFSAIAPLKQGLAHVRITW